MGEAQAALRPWRCIFQRPSYFLVGRIECAAVQISPRHCERFPFVVLPVLRLYLFFIGNVDTGAGGQFLVSEELVC